MFHEKEGAYTGENSPYVAEVMGATYALVGHSERRQIFGEQNSLICRKVAFASESRLTPMLCVGETLAEREANQTNKVISEQLELGLSELPKGRQFIVAYEPVWAIGTGKVATPEQAEEAHAFLRLELKRLRGAEVANTTAILYGGSVKGENAPTLISQPNIDGFLVGGASLKPAEFASIVKSLGC
jgi:triosephosphate isomerase